MKFLGVSGVFDYAGLSKVVFCDWLQQQLSSRRLTGAEIAERAGVTKASALECSYD